MAKDKEIVGRIVSRGGDRGFTSDAIKAIRKFQGKDTTTPTPSPIPHKTPEQQEEVARSSIPSKASIAQHWFDQMETMEFEKIMASSPWKRLVRVDCYEPACWACGYYDGIVDLEGTGRWSTWNKADFLQRCHIVPKSMGGSNNHDNLFLMCRTCHDLAPDSIHPKQFYKWVEKRKDHWQYRMEEMQDTLEIFDLNPNDFLDEQGEIVDLGALFEETGLHLHQVNGGSRIKLSSLCAVIAEHKEKRTKDVLDKE